MVAGALALAIVGMTATPADAATRTYDDEVGDVTDEEGDPAVDPRADILGVTVQNDPGVVQVTIQVGEALAASDPAWRSDMGISLSLVGANAGGGMFVFSGSGGPVTFQLGYCPVDLTVDTAADRYVLRVDDECVRGYPRTVRPLVLLFHGDNLDTAPFDLLAGEGEVPEPVVSSPTVDVRRLAGTDRTLTAIELSKDRFAADGADAVVLASASSFPDALAGGPLATYSSAPVLLTGTASLDARTAGEIGRVLAPSGTVYVLGGTAALSQQVVSDLQSAGFAPERVAGTDRFGTAVAIAEEAERVINERFAALMTVVGGDVTTDTEVPVVLADGRTFTDALIAGAAAARTGAVLLLSDGATMPATTKAYIDENDSSVVTIGAAATSAAPGSDESVTGATPGQLSSRVLEELFIGGGTVAVASEDTFADALAGGGNIGGLGGLLLTDGATLDQFVQTSLEGSAVDLREVVILGGTAAISSAVEQQIEAAVG